MVMRGIDISNWQGGLNLEKVPVDFAIFKATEGLNFVDSYCDEWVNQAKKLSMPWGFYHFARENDPTKEAEFFYNHCKNYFGVGVPVLDWEVETNWSWCEKFVQKLYDLSGIWCVVYMSAYRVKQFKNSWIPKKCGLWIAGYPKTYAYWPTNVSCPYDIAPWENVAMWQFSSEVILPGYVGKLDGDIAYMDEIAWKKYAGKANSKQVKQKTTYDKTTEELAREVLADKHGSGAKRRKSLGKRYSDVQAYIDKLYTVADEVIAGKWGNGQTRKKKLKAAGYPYDLVQKIVNDKMA